MTVTMQASRLSDVLHRSLHPQSDGWLLIDPGARGLPDDAPLMQILSDHPLTPVPSAHRELDPTLTPRLAPLDTARFRDSDVLQQTLALALEELEPESLRQGAGRQVCAWLQCSSEIPTDEQRQLLTAHVSRTCVQRHARETHLLRWYDPAVLWGLWPLLTETQQTTLLGPIERLWLLDPIGELLLLTRPAASSQSSLALTREQWQHLNHLTALNAAFRNVTLPSDAAKLRALRTHVLQALERARSYGIDDAEDLAHFARLTIDVQPYFDRHPLIQERLQQRAADSYFSSVVDDLTDDDWRSIRTGTAATSRT